MSPEVGFGHESDIATESPNVCFVGCVAASTSIYEVTPYPKSTGFSSIGVPCGVRRAAWLQALL